MMTFRVVLQYRKKYEEPTRWLMVHCVEETNERFSWAHEKCVQWMKRHREHKKKQEITTVQESDRRKTKAITNGVKFVFFNVSLEERNRSVYLKAGKLGVILYR